MNRADKVISNVNRIAEFYISNTDNEQHIYSVANDKGAKASPILLLYHQFI